MNQPACWFLGMQMLVERIMSVGQESTEELAPIEGIMEQPVVPLLQAAKQCGSGSLAQTALAWARSSPANDGTLTVDEMAAIYMYTMARWVHLSVWKNSHA